MNTTTNIRTTDEIIKENHIVFKNSCADKAMPVEIEIGFEDFDFFTGLVGGELITIAGWPSMGKTSFALSIVRNVCVGQGIPTLCLTPAICSMGVLQRLVASHCKIALSRIRSGNITEEEQPRYDAGIDELAKSPLYIDDCTGADLDKICDICREAVEKFHVRLAFIDNVQTIVSNHRLYKTHVEEIEDIMYSLKRLARELEIPIVVVSQTTNTSFHPHPLFDQMPQNSETGILGAIEEASDKVFFIYRPEEYGIKMDDFGWDMKDKAYVMLVKNNTANTTIERLGFDDIYGRFQELYEPLSSLND